MYAALWRLLPGPTWARVLWFLGLVLLVAVVCVQWVYPWLAEVLPWDNANLGG